MDCSHKNGTIVSEHRKKNRARGGAKRNENKTMCMRNNAKPIRAL